MQQPESTIEYRLHEVERRVGELKQQLSTYVPVAVNDLQLQSIKGTVERIERDVQDARRQLGDVNTKIVSQQTESERRDTQQRESLANLKIRVLWYVVSTVMGIGLLVLGAFLTGLIGR